MSEFIIFISFGCFLLLGGFLGKRAGSRISFLMGLASGLIVLALSAFYKQNPHTSLTGLTAVGLFLSLTFLIRFIKTKKIMPAGMLLTVSILFSIFCFSLLK